MQTIITKNFTQTQNLGKKFAEKLTNGGIVALYGNLGSGKTTFIQGFAKGLGIKNKIISPTFIIVRKYEINLKSSISNLKSFYHIDLYRIENEAGLQGLGLEEILNDASNIVAIEWPEKIEKFLPDKTIKINFEYLPSGMIGHEKDERRIKINQTI